VNAEGRCAGMRCPGRAPADGAVVAAVVAPACEDNAVVAALAPVAERLVRHPRTPMDAAPACAVAIERALADEAEARGNGRG